MEFGKYQYIGKLNIEFLEIEFGKLATEELILTDERDGHIKERHEQDYNLFHKCIYDVVNMPDMILKDSKNQNTVFYIKYIEETHLNIVVRLSLEIEGANRKNSIITSYQLGTKTLKRLKKNNKTLYNKE
ncbi:PBECR2 nuclease fold domain-containing protein [uncultured Eubacterium sp.]|uniref:PBECR2 nuclease fold domain-containing protein n=1 Tax=uncultured Eubacterium sp. TaxID=165185 RepID=UPI0025F003EE|nr:PBECR2 nuclease fold domain-containing protein [uncultured Eubacterium sp.]